MDVLIQNIVLYRGAHDRKRSGIVRIKKVPIKRKEIEKIGLQGPLPLAQLAFRSMDITARANFNVHKKKTGTQKFIRTFYL